MLLGASADPAIIRGRMVRAMQGCGFDGPVYCVSRSHDEIGGFPTFQSVEDLPEPVDLALVTIPAHLVAGALESCGQLGVKAAVIISSGFSEERSAAGLERQAEVSAIAERYDMAVIGPNAEGFMNTALPITASFSPAVIDFDGDLLPAASRSNGIAVVSHSGGVGFSFYNRGRPKELRFSHVVSIGNEAGVDSLDLVDFLLDDEDTGVLTMFVEGLKRPEKLAPVAARAARVGKPMIIAKMGRSEAGAAAVASHTASLAGSYRTYQAMFDRLGIVAADHTEELVDLAAAFAYFRECLPAGKRVAVLTPSGGAGIWLADTCVRAGLQVPELDSDTRAAIDAHLPAYGSSRNPVDITAQALNALGYARPIEILADSPEVDGIIVASSLIHPRHIEADEDNLVALRRHIGKPVIFCAYTEAHPRAVEILSRAGFPCFTNMPNAARAMAELARYADFQSRFAAEDSTTEPAEDPEVRDALRGAGTFTEHRTKAVLADHGLPITPGVLARSVGEAGAYLEGHSGRFAFKVQSSAIPHKTEAGGVALNVEGPLAASQEFERIVASARAFAGDEAIDGVLIEPMAAPGVEMIVGVTSDPDFGLMLLVGSGGVLVELLDDVALSPVPVSAAEAERMLDSLAGSPILAGTRGGPPADRPALVRLMTQVSDFAARAGDALVELDLNPVIVHGLGDGVTIADALLVSG